jgi:predicted 3-demethylubiquinone-9 3-methyltransferase (glyoxalase superfamily)
MTDVTPFLWFDDQAQEAMALYAEVFGVPIDPIDPDAPFQMGTLTLPGLTLMLFNGGPYFTFNEAVSLFVSVETQEEVDHLWEGLLAGGGQPSQCGWLKDRFGVSWQICPTALHRLMGDPDPVKATRVREAMLKMGKIEIAGLQAAYDRDDSEG